MGQAPKDAAKARDARVAVNKLEDEAIVATLTATHASDWIKSSFRPWGSRVALERADWRGMVEPPLEERLEMTADQIGRARAIFRESIKQIDKAASFSIVLADESGQPTSEAIRKLVDGREFQAAREAIRKLVELRRVSGREGQSRQGRARGERLGRSTDRGDSERQATIDVSTNHR